MNDKYLTVTQINKYIKYKYFKNQNSVINNGVNIKRVKA